MIFKEKNGWNFPLLNKDMSLRLKKSSGFKSAWVWYIFSLGHIEIVS